MEEASSKYGNSKGSEHLRNAISTYLSSTRGVVADAQNVLITKGSQMGIYLASQLLLKPADNIAVGLSSYSLADETFRQTGAKLIRIPVDEHGMDIDFLKKVLQRRKIKAVYSIPHHHCPTTVTMSMERRLKLRSSPGSIASPFLKTITISTFIITTSPTCPWPASIIIKT